MKLLIHYIAIRIDYLPTVKHLVNRHRLQRLRVADVTTQLLLFRQRNFSFKKRKISLTHTYKKINKDLPLTLKHFAERMLCMIHM
jgi:hypothetical protein